MKNIIMCKYNENIKEVMQLDFYTPTNIQDVFLF